MIYACYRIARRNGLGVVDVRQAFDLHDVKNRVALHVGDFALDILASFFVMLGARDGVGIDYERTLLSLAHMRVQFAGLAEGHPDRDCKVLAESGHPEGQYVDSGVGLAVKTQRTSNSAGGVLSIPRTSPGTDAFFQILHDLCGDATVN